MEKNRAIEYLRKGVDDREKHSKYCESWAGRMAGPDYKNERQKYKRGAKESRAFIADAEAVIAAWEAVQLTKESENE